jgi:hypothetical protein
MIALASFVFVPPFFVLLLFSAAVCFGLSFSIYNRLCNFFKAFCILT